MPHTPYPWAVGNGCVIAPTVPYAESRHKHYDDIAKRRNPRSRSSFDYYGGELVAESCTIEDCIAIATTTRQVTLLLGFAERIAEQSTDELARQMAAALLIVCASIDRTVREEAKEHHERGLYARETEYMQERAVIGLLPASVPVRPIDPYTPSHEYVTDNIEVMWEIRTRSQAFRRFMSFHDEVPF